MMPARNVAKSARPINTAAMKCTVRSRPAATVMLELPLSRHVIGPMPAPYRSYGVPIAEVDVQALRRPPRRRLGIAPGVAKDVPRPLPRFQSCPAGLRSCEGILRPQERHAPGAFRPSSRGVPSRPPFLIRAAPCYKDESDSAAE